MAILDDADWYITSTVLDEDNTRPVYFPGTEEEREFCYYINSVMDLLNDKYKKVFLLRNEEKIKLYDYQSGKGFQPDYILYLQKDDKLFYYVLIEPKGPHLINPESFKELFLARINSSFGINGESLHANNFEYKIIGLPFYVSKNSIKVFNKDWKLPNQDDRTYENFDNAFRELLK